MSPHAEQTIPAVVRDAIAAANTHDTEAFLAQFAPDGAVDDWGSVYRGQDEIRRWSDREFIGVDVSLTHVTTAPEDSGARVAVRAAVGGHGFNGPSTFTFTLDGEHIALMQITG